MCDAFILCVTVVQGILQCFFCLLHCCCEKAIDTRYLRFPLKLQRVYANPTAVVHV